MTDHYQTLGVSRSATQEEIKKAYKKLASKHHPDKGGETSKFQEIQKAYDILNDPVKKQQYDNPTQFHSSFDQNSTHYEFNFTGGDFFDQFFTHGFGGQNPFRQQARRNKDLRINVTVPLSSTLSDQTKTVNVQTTKGDTTTVEITIPRGSTHGTTIKYAGMGDNFFDSLPKGDLYVIINLIVDERFQIEGANLITTIEINSIDAILGIDKEVIGVDGKTFSVKIPAGCQFGNKFGLHGQGLYGLNTTRRGDLIVSVIIKTPTLNLDQLSKFNEFWKSLNNIE